MRIHHVESSSFFETEIELAGLERDVSVLHITDSHLWELNEADVRRIEEKLELEAFVGKISRRMASDRFAEAIGLANEWHVDHVVFTGDIFSFPSEANFRLLDRKLAELQMPYSFTLGNHDWQFLMLEDWNDQVRRECYPRFYPYTKGVPAFSSVNVGGVRLLTVDNSNYQVDEQQLAFVEAELRSGDPCMLFMHIPMYVESLAVDVRHRWQAPILVNGEGWTEELLRKWKTRPSDPSTRAFCELLKRGETAESVAGIFCGHVHFPHKDEYRPGRYQYVTHPGFEGGYRLIRLKKVCAP